MRNNSISLEEGRLMNNGVEEKPFLHERHRAFPAVFENRDHKRILDVAAGVGYAANRIHKNYSGQIFCNDLSPTCLKNLRQLKLPVTRYSIDNDVISFPFASNSFNAVIALATIEHVIQVDDFVKEIYRILDDDGCFYVSAPNYASLLYLLPVVVSGRTFHNPLNPSMKYEFYAHVRYFTYRTLIEYIPQFGFTPEAVYLPLPKSSTSFTDLQARSKLKAAIFKVGMSMLYRISPRWASEPIICFRKSKNRSIKFRHVLL
jgi:ubiquinone/menaquinone biosynthesis C-methylase UbiE